MAGNKNQLSNRELDIMNAFWNSDKSLIASEIVQINPDLSINTVQATLKKLLNKSYIKIAEIVYSGTVLTRSYAAVVDRDEYMIRQIRENNIPVVKLVLQLISEETDTDVLNQVSAAVNKRLDELGM